METLRNEETAECCVRTDDFIKALSLKAIFRGGGELCFRSTSSSRPGLFLSGFTQHFAESRIQVLGMAEMNYLKSLDADTRLARLNALFATCIPCIIISRGLQIPPDFKELSEKYKKPLFQSQEITSELQSDVSAYLNDLLASNTSLHGVLVDLYGIGVMIKGDSGIGKSEVAIELVNRGHRLVADDVVLLRRIKDRLFGESPEMIRHFMEIRGVGIIDVKAIFGAGSVLEKHNVELIIQLEKWDETKAYERVGKTHTTESILELEIPRLVIPVTPGRNLAVVIEVAVRDFMLKQSGYIPCEVLAKRMKS